MEVKDYHPQYKSNMIDMIVAFYEVHANFFHLPKEDQKKQLEDAKETLKSWLETSQRLFVLLENQEVCGFLHIAYRSRTVVWIEDVYVIEKYRCHGRATQAIQEVESILQQDECVQAICMDVVPRNQAALHLYHSLGYDNLSLLTLRKECKTNLRDQETKLFDLTFKI